MSVDFEQEIYGEILDAYNQYGPGTLFEYKELIKLMKFKSRLNGYHGSNLNTIITNSMILLIGLFFQDKQAPLVYGQCVTMEERQKIIHTFKKLL